MALSTLDMFWRTTVDGSTTRQSTLISAWKPSGWSLLGKEVVSVEWCCPRSTS